VESLLQQAAASEAWDAKDGAATPETIAQESSLDEMPAGEMPVEAEAVTRRPARTLTPEQHQQKILRDRARRAAKSKGAIEAASAEAALAKEQMTQEERDRPYRESLSARIQAHDVARARRIYESQQRSAASKPKVAFR